MSQWNIYRKDGLTVRCSVRKLEYSAEFMGACSVTVSVSSPTPVNFSIGDYIEYRGERFELNYDPSVVKQSSYDTYGEGFTYENIKFNSLSDELTRCDFLDYVESDNQLHYSSLPNFSFFADSIYKLAERIKVNLDRVYTGEKEWTIEVLSDGVNTSNVNISVSSISCWEALALVKEHFDANFIIRGRTITIGTAGVAVNQVFGYGKGNGLVSIERNAEQDQAIVTRLRAYGSTRNMPAGYYHNYSDNVPNNMAVQNLMLPSFPDTTLDPYIDSSNVSELGVREGTIFFDGSGENEEIYPSMEGMTAEDLIAAGIPTTATGDLDVVYSAEQITDNGIFVPEEGAESVEIPPFTITLKDIGFDINDYLSTANATISMKDGMCGGREFEIVKCEKDENNRYVLTCNRSEDSGLGLFFPYKDYQINTGDKFVLLNIEMPDVYIKAASQRLLEAATAWLAKNDYVRYSYTPTIDNIWMQRQHDAAVEGGYASIHDTIKEGDLLLFEDSDLGIDGSVIIDQLTIKEDSDDSVIPQYEITLRNDKVVGTIDKLQNQIDSIAAGGQGGGYNAQQIQSLIQAYGNQYFLSKIRDDRSRGSIASDKSIEVGNFISGRVGGSGAKIEASGYGEMKGLILHEFLDVPELRYNKLDMVSGELWNSVAFGIVESVDTDACICRLKLEEREMGGLHVDDICRGIFADFGTDSMDEDVDECGFKRIYGFRTSYFTVSGIIENTEGSFSFYYSVRTGTDGTESPHPCASMKFSVYGNFSDNKRQASAYSTKTYKRYLNNVNTWEITQSNIYAQYGDLSELTFNGTQLTGYGSLQSNSYLTGVHIQLDDDLYNDLSGKDAYSVMLSADNGTILIDSEGNIVDGIEETKNVTTEGENVVSGEDNVVVTDYRLRTTVQAYKGSNALVYSDTIAEGCFTVRITEMTGCEAIMQNGIVAVTSVIDYNRCKVEISVICEGNATIVKTYSVTPVMKGDSASFATIYSSEENPDAPTPYPNTNTQWSEELKDDSKWMATASSVNGVWTDWNILSLNGKDSIDYYISPENSFVTRTATGSFDPSAFTLVCYKNTNGTSTPIEAVWTVERINEAGNGYVALDETFTGSEYVFEVKGDLASHGKYRIKATVDGVEVRKMAFVTLTNEGRNGAMPRACGLWNSTREYVYNEEYRDIVYMEDGGVWMVKTYSLDGSVSGEDKMPPAKGSGETDYWKEGNKEVFTAIDTALIDSANIAGFMYKDELMVSTERNDEVTKENPLGSMIVLNGKTGYFKCEDADVTGNITAGVMSFKVKEGGGDLTGFGMAYGQGVYTLPSLEKGSVVEILAYCEQLSRTPVTFTFQVPDGSSDYIVVALDGDSALWAQQETSVMPDVNTLVTFMGRCDSEGVTSWTVGGSYGISGQSVQVIVDDAMDETSEYPVQNKVIVSELKKFGPIVYDDTYNYWKLAGDLLVTGGVTMFANEGTYTPSTIMDGIEVDGTTISKANGYLEVVGGTGSSIDFPLLWKGYSNGSWDGSSSATITIPSKVSELTNDSNYLTEITSSMVTSALGYTPLEEHQDIYTLTFSAGTFSAGSYTPNSAAKTIYIPTSTSHLSNDSDFTTNEYVDDTFLPLTGGTLSGWLNIKNGSSNYGGYLYFGDRSYVYLHEDIDDHLLIYADKGVTIDTGSDGTLYVEGNLVVSGGITMYATDSSSSSSIMDGLVLDPDTLEINSSGQLTVIGGTGGGASSWDELEDIPSYLGTSGLANSLSITVGSNSAVSYNGSSAKSISVNYSTLGLDSRYLGISATAASANKVANSLSITVGSNSAVSYNGSTSRSISINYSTLGLDSRYVGVDDTLLTLNGSSKDAGSASFYAPTSYGTSGYVLKSNGSGAPTWTAQSSLSVGSATTATTASKLSTVSKEAWGQTYWTSGGVPTSISGNMTDVGSISPNASNARSIGSSSNTFLHVYSNYCNAGSGNNLWLLAGSNYGIVFGTGTSSSSYTSFGKWTSTGLGIGTGSPSCELHVKGNILATGGITMYGSSDKRLKNNIRAFNASEELMNLGGVYQFEYNDDEVERNKIYNGTHIGLIYQNVKESSLAKMCFEREDGYGALNYLDTSFISLLAAVEIEHETRLQKLERENEELKKEIELLKAV